jgi:hypothetical protein
MFGSEFSICLAVRWPGDAVRSSDSRRNFELSFGFVHRLLVRLAGWLEPPVNMDGRGDGETGIVDRFANVGDAAAGFNVSVDVVVPKFDADVAGLRGDFDLLKNRARLDRA